MTDDRKSGIALITGSLGGLFTMAIHPTGGGAAHTPGQAEHLALASAVAHSIAIVSVVLLFLGACGLTRRLAASARTPDPDRLAFAAIVTFGFACVSILIAASVSGFIVPNFLNQMIRDGATASQYHPIVDAIFQFNQTFSRIFSVAASVAIALWSVSALRNGGIGRGIAIYGCIVAALLTVGLVIGHLRLDVHGMTVVVIGQVVWFIVAGVQMFRSQERMETQPGD